MSPFRHTDNTHAQGSDRNARACATEVCIHTYIYINIYLYLYISFGTGREPLETLFEPCELPASISQGPRGAFGNAFRALRASSFALTGPPKQRFFVHGFAQVRAHFACARQSVAQPSGKNFFVRFPWESACGFRGPPGPGGAPASSGPH